jgi:hypothetical protein
MAGVIQCRRPPSQVRVVRQRKRRQAIGHERTDCPIGSVTASALEQQRRIVVAVDIERHLDPQPDVV